MGKKHSAVGLLVLALAAGGVQAHDSNHERDDDDRPDRGKMFISPYVGYAHLRLNNGTVWDQEETLRFDALQAGLAIGYRAPFGLTVEIGRSTAVHADFFDDSTGDFDLKQTYGAIGWQLDFGDGWQFTPRVGRTRWQLGSDERNLIAPNGDVVREFEGWQNFWAASITRALGDVASMGFNFKDIDQPYGHARIAEFTVKFQF
jgi:hypothetical protein